MAADLTADAIVGMLADGDRLRVVAALALGAVSLSDVVELAGTDTRTAGAALARLVDSGLVEIDAHGYRLVEERLRAVARTAASSPHRDETFDDVDADVARVLRAFVRDDRLQSIPMQRSKRLIVLDLLVQDFEPGIRYRESAVNEKLRRWHDDVASLRRYLVEEGFLEREGGGGRYWRAGGTFRI